MRWESSTRTKSNHPLAIITGMRRYHVPVPKGKRHAILEEKKTWVSQYKRPVGLVNFSNKAHDNSAHSRWRTLSNLKRRTRAVLQHHPHHQSSNSATCRLWPFLRRRDWRFRAPSSSSTLARECRLLSLRRKRLRASRHLPRTGIE